MQPTTLPFRDFLVYAGDSASYENFAKFPLAMSSRGWSEDIKSTNITVPDQDNEDLVVAEQSIPSTVTRQMTGKGTLGTSDYPIWRGYLGIVMNYQVRLKQVGYWQGPMILSKISMSGSRANIVEVDITLDAADQMSFIAGDPPAGAQLNKKHKGSSLPTAVPQQSYP
ncbi:MAG TPA: hypothetical protein VNX86_04755 [Rhizomicrobium sp.]|jgi:hypothetical protein|nr:hypothetical protein [Rhizomicrobium sp.]